MKKSCARIWRIKTNEQAKKETTTTKTDADEKIMIAPPKYRLTLFLIRVLSFSLVFSLYVFYMYSNRNRELSKRLVVAFFLCFLCHFRAHTNKACERQIRVATRQSEARFYSRPPSINSSHLLLSLSSSSFV